MKASEVYEEALALIDEIDIDGTIDTDATETYYGKAPRLINTLNAELAKIEGRTVVNKITALTDDITVSDDVGRRVMPYGLAWLFALADNNADLSNTYEVEYQRKKRQISRPEVDIIDEYDVLSGMKS